MERSLASYSPWGSKESNMTEQLTRSHLISRALAFFFLRKTIFILESIGLIKDVSMRYIIPGDKVYCVSWCSYPNDPMASSLFFIVVLGVLFSLVFLLFCKLHCFGLSLGSSADYEYICEMEFLKLAPRSGFH